MSFPLLGDLPNAGVELASPELQADSLPLNHLGSPRDHEDSLNAKLGMNSPRRDGPFAVNSTYHCASENLFGSGFFYMQNY